MALGLAESGFYPGMQNIIGSWYHKDELAKRSCIFHTRSALATMFSGYFMAAVLQLDGRGGFAGGNGMNTDCILTACAAVIKLRLFIMNGVISWFRWDLRHFCIGARVQFISSCF